MLIFSVIQQLEEAQEIDYFTRQKLAALIMSISKTYEFQRLQKISSLGARSQHKDLNRYNHSCETCCYTIDLLNATLPELKRQDIYNENKLCACIIAALLHDVGHAPLSHSFERIANSKGFMKNHEDWTQEIILGNTGINEALTSYASDFPKQVAEILYPKGEKNFYNLLISSQIDADRIAYLKKDSKYQRHVSSDFDYEQLKEFMIPLKLPEGREVIAFGYQVKNELTKFFKCLFKSYNDNYMSLENSKKEYILEGAIIKGLENKSNIKNPFVVFLNSPEKTLDSYLALKEEDFLSLGNGHINDISIREVNSFSNYSSSLVKIGTSPNLFAIPFKRSAYNPDKDPVYIVEKDGSIVKFSIPNQYIDRGLIISGIGDFKTENTSKKIRKHLVMEKRAFNTR